MIKNKQSQGHVSASDMKQAVSKVRESMDGADIQECDNIACVIEVLLNNITASQKNISKQMRRVSTNV